MTRACTRAQVHMRTRVDIFADNCGLDIVECLSAEFHLGGAGDIIADDCGPFAVSGSPCTFPPTSQWRPERWHTMCGERKHVDGEVQATCTAAMLWKLNEIFTHRKPFRILCKRLKRLPTGRPSTNCPFHIFAPFVSYKVPLPSIAPSDHSPT